MVAPKFSDTFTLFQPGGGADSSQHHRGCTKNFPTVTYMSIINKVFLMLWNILYGDSCSVTVTVQCKSKHATNCITGAPVAFKTWCAHQYRVVGLRWLPKLGVENSHADLVEVIQGLRRDLNSKMHVCRGNEEVSSQKIHNIKVESEESFDQSNFFESSQTNKQNMSANTSSYTPPRTPRISGLKSQILKPTFLS